MYKRKSVLSLLSIITLFFCTYCNDNGVESDFESDEIDLDGRGGGVIAYCYQPVTSDHTKKEIYAINADGSGNVGIISTDLSLNHHDWSPDAQRIAAVGYTNETTWSIYVFTVDGSGLTRLTATDNVWDINPAWSPDGSRIAFIRFYSSQSREEIWVMNADGSNPQYIGVEGGWVKWSPDGTRFIYHSLRNDSYNIYTCDIDGQNEETIVSTGAGEIVPAWSSDASEIAFVHVDDDLNHTICIVDSNGTNLRQLTEGGTPSWSPNDSLIAFHSGPFENWEVFVINADGTNRRQVTDSPAGITAINPVWKPE